MGTGICADELVFSLCMILLGMDSLFILLLLKNERTIGPTSNLLLVLCTLLPGMFGMFPVLLTLTPLFSKSFPPAHVGLGSRYTGNDGAEAGGGLGDGVLAAGGTPDGGPGKTGAELNSGCGE